MWVTLGDAHVFAFEALTQHIQDAGGNFAEFRVLRQEKKCQLHSKPRRRPVLQERRGGETYTRVNNCKDCF